MNRSWIAPVLVCMGIASGCGSCEPGSGVVRNPGTLVRTETLVNCGCTWNWAPIAADNARIAEQQNRMIGVCLPPELNVHLADDARREEILAMTDEEYFDAVSEFCNTVARSHQISVQGFLRSQACGYFSVPVTTEVGDPPELVPNCQPMPWDEDMGLSASIAEPTCEVECVDIPCTTDNCALDVVLTDRMHYENCECTDVSGCGETSTSLCRPVLTSDVVNLWRPDEECRCAGEPDCECDDTGMSTGPLVASPVIVDRPNRTGVLTAIAARPTTFRIGEGSEARVSARVCDRILGVEVCSSASDVSDVGGRMDFFGAPCSTGTCEMDVELWLQGSAVLLEFDVGPINVADVDLTDLKMFARGRARIVDGHATIPAGQLAISSAAASDLRAESGRFIGFSTVPVELDVNFETGTLHMPEAPLEVSGATIAFELVGAMEAPFLEVDGGPDQVVECTGDMGATVQLSATSSRMGTLFGWWSGPAFGVSVSDTELSSPAITVTSSLGENVYTVTGSVAPAWAIAEDEVLVTVEDTTAPELDVSVSPSVIWPPNHAMVEIVPTFDVDDVCEGSLSSLDVQLVSVTSSEATNGSGDGATSPDVRITSDGKVFVLAERSGNGTDRVYELRYRITDASGNLTESTAQVRVPRERPRS